MKSSTLEIGKKYGKRTVLKEAYIKNSIKFYTCQCECGHIGDVSGYAINKGRSLMCYTCGKAGINKKPVEEKKIKDKWHKMIYGRWNYLVNRYLMSSDLVNFEDFKNWCHAKRMTQDDRLKIIDKTKEVSKDNLRLVRSYNQNKNLDKSE